MKLTKFNVVESYLIAQIWQMLRIESFK